MIGTIATYLNFFLILLSLIVLVELMVVFKRPLILKVHLIILIIGILFSTLGYLLANLGIYNFLYTDGAKPIMGIVIINFFLLLCNHRLDKRVIILELVILFLIN